MEKENAIQDIQTADENSISAQQVQEEHCLNLSEDEIANLNQLFDLGEKTICGKYDLIITDYKPSWYVERPPYKLKSSDELVGGRKYDCLNVVICAKDIHDAETVIEHYGCPQNIIFDKYYTNNENLLTEGKALLRNLNEEKLPMNFKFKPLEKRYNGAVIELLNYYLEHSKDVTYEQKWKIRLDRLQEISDLNDKFFALEHEVIRQIKNLYDGLKSVQSNINIDDLDFECIFKFFIRKDHPFYKDDDTPEYSSYDNELFSYHYHAHINLFKDGKEIDYCEFTSVENHNDMGHGTDFRKQHHCWMFHELYSHLGIDFEDLFLIDHSITWYDIKFHMQHISGRF